MHIMRCVSPPSGKACGATVGRPWQAGLHCWVSSSWSLHIWSRYVDTKRMALTSRTSPASMNFGWANVLGGSTPMKHIRQPTDHVATLGNIEKCFETTSQPAIMNFGSANGKQTSTVATTFAELCILGPPRCFSQHLTLAAAPRPSRANWSMAKDQHTNHSQCCTRENTTNPSSQMIDCASTSRPEPMSNSLLCHSLVSKGNLTQINSTACP